MGIAGTQTGVYPIDSPGGWAADRANPPEALRPRRERPILLEAGQYIKFRAVDREEYEAIGREVEQGTYRLHTYAKEG